MICALLAVLLFGVEVFIAVKLRAYPCIRGSLGDFLVVILLFVAAKAVWPLEGKRLALQVFAFACVIETAQFFRLADLLGFPRGSIPSIVLGTTFSWEDIIMYGLGCLVAAGLDQRLAPAESKV